MELFHVHTFRCKHAEDVPDEKYILRAIEMGAEKITFTDHAPFPGDPFGYRMDMAELEEYLDTLTALKNKYKEEIEICVGLETEYFPSYEYYYKELSEDKRIDFLLLGQHMAEISEPNANKKEYSFSLNRKELDEKEYLLLGNAIIQGIKSGYFSVVAHPDRSYRRNLVWDGDKAALADKIIEAAGKYNVKLEKNMTSKKTGLYKQEFWDMAENRADIIIGLDAHTVEELDMIYDVK